MGEPAPGDRGGGAVGSREVGAPIDRAPDTQPAEKEDVLVGGIDGQAVGVAAVDLGLEGAEVAHGVAGTGASQAPGDAVVQRAVDLGHAALEQSVGARPEGGVDHGRISRGHRDLDEVEAASGGGQSAGIRTAARQRDPLVQRTPGVPAIGGTEDPTAEKAGVEMLLGGGRQLEIRGLGSVRSRHQELREGRSRVVRTKDAESGGGRGCRDRRLRRGHGRTAGQRHENALAGARGVRIEDDVVDGAPAEVEGSARAVGPREDRDLAATLGADQEARSVIGVATDRVLAGSREDPRAARSAAAVERDGADGEGVFLVGLGLEVQASVERVPDTPGRGSDPDVVGVHRIHGDGGCPAGGATLEKPNDRRGTHREPGRALNVRARGRHQRGDPDDESDNPEPHCDLLPPLARGQVVTGADRSAGRAIRGPPDRHAPSPRSSRRSYSCRAQ